jgi:hypothetical protein
LQGGKSSNSQVPFFDGHSHASSIFVRCKLSNYGFAEVGFLLAMVKLPPDLHMEPNFYLHQRNQQKCICGNPKYFAYAI